MKNKILISNLTLFPWSFIFAPQWLCNFVHRAGYDGVEVTMLGHWDSLRVYEWEKATKSRNLILHFHQGWSRMEAHYLIFGVKEILSVLRMFRFVPGIRNRIPYLPPERPPLSYYPINALRAHPFVSYAERVAECRRNNHKVWFQTVATAGEWAGTFQSSYDQFVTDVTNYHLPVVFDTQHVLEFMEGRPGVEHLTHHTEKAMREKLFRAWKYLGKYTKEIHLNNFCAVTGERNVMPSSGQLNLRDFLQKTQPDRNVFLVPELAPRIRKMYSNAELIKLRELCE